MLKKVILPYRSDDLRVRSGYSVGTTKKGWNVVSGEYVVLGAFIEEHEALEALELLKVLREPEEGWTVRKELG